MRVVLALLLFSLISFSFVEAALGMEACTRNTPIGIGCHCNSRIVSTRQFPGWQPAGGNYHSGFFVRPGWHVTNFKGTHDGGNVCYRDRAATPEERAIFLRTGH
jgi:hypothetical protein